jgi:hypothetical protein
LLYNSINTGLLVLIWLVQIIIYPSLHNWDKETFTELHRSYTLRISLIVGPLMLAQALCAVQQVIRTPDLVSIVQVLLIASVLTVTALISVPLHRRLSSGYRARVVDRLIHTNWLRTVGWSLVSLIGWLR